MNPFAKTVSLGAIVAWAFLPDVQAANNWTLSTADTKLKISVSNNKIYIAEFKNPAQDWNWTPVNSEVPLPGKDSIRSGQSAQTPDWQFAGATEAKSGGHAVTLRFISATPA